MTSHRNLSPSFISWVKRFLFEACTIAEGMCLAEMFYISKIICVLVRDHFASRHSRTMDCNLVKHEIPAPYETNASEIAFVYLIAGIADVSILVPEAFQN